MKLINFQDKLSSEKEDAVNSAIEYLKKSTNFLIIFSNDHISSSEYMFYNMSPIDSISSLEITKHSIINKTMPNNDPEEEEYFNVGGINND